MTLVVQAMGIVGPKLSNVSWFLYIICIIRQYNLVGYLVEI